MMELGEMIGTHPIIMAGACVLVLDNQNGLLLQRRRDNGCWGLPGGLRESGESMEQVAKRKIFEETGFTSGALQLLDVFSGMDMYYQYPHGDEVYNVVAAYICHEYEGVMKADSAEEQELFFFRLTELPASISPPDVPVIHAFFENYLSQLQVK